MNELLQTAFFWKKMGIATIPLRYMDKHPDGRLLPDGKWESFQKQLPTDDDLLRWFPGRLHNIGIITGWQNLIVIDFDDLSTFVKWALWTTRTGGFTRRAVEMTYMVKTSRGMHVYFRTSQPESNRKLDKIDIKATGGYVLAPPSIHPSGLPYETYQKGIPAKIDALSDVLPAVYLLQHTEYQGTAQKPTALPTISDDPWEVAMKGPDPNQDLIAQIRTHYPIASFFSNTEETSHDGRWLMTVCPFHDDKNPSFWIDTQRGICSCYSCGGKPMDAINLFARLHGLSNRDAILYMARGL